MDAHLVRNLQHHSRKLPLQSAAAPLEPGTTCADFRMTALLLVLLLCGCQGKSLVAENPVFSELPPRRSLVNNATRERSAESDGGKSGVKLVSVTSSTEPMAGNMVVAEVNGRPLFVDDLVGSIRLTLQADHRYSAEQQNQVLLEQIKQRLDQRVDEEIILHQLEARLPEEQRDGLKGHIEDAFQQFLESRTQELMAEGKIKSAEELEPFLAQGGLSVALLRETFFRIQMVNGYMQSLTDSASAGGGSTDRLELLEYYRNNIDRFTPEERLRWQEIRISIREQGGREPAKQRMQEVLRLIKSEQMDFGAVARRYSDALSAEDAGNRKWLSRGALRDQQLEATLFALPGGGITQVIEDENYLSIYRVARHEYATPQPFSAVQSEIEAAIRQEQATEARKKVMDELRAAASVRTIFDENSDL